MTICLLAPDNYPNLSYTLSRTQHDELYVKCLKNTLNKNYERLL